MVTRQRYRFRRSLERVYDNRSVASQRQFQQMNTMTSKKSWLHATFVLLPFALGMPVLAFGWALRQELVHAFLIAALLSSFLITRWLLRTVKPTWFAKLSAGIVAIFSIVGLLLTLLVQTLQATQLTQSLGDGCRVDAVLVGGFGDTDLNLSRFCSVGGLWEIQTPLLSDSAATISRLALALPAVNGAEQVTATLSRYGKPDEEFTLRMPAR